MHAAVPLLGRDDEMLDFVIFASTVVIGLLIILIFCWAGDGRVREKG